MVRPVPKPEDGVSLARRCVMYLLPPSVSRPIASHLVPLLVCLSLIPLLLLLSLFSGWYIWKNVPVAWHVPIYLQYGSASFPPSSVSDPNSSDGPSPFAELSLPPLSTAQPYDISLQLLLPATEANFALGNFMATLSLSTPSNKTLVTVSRPVRVFRSPSSFLLTILRLLHSPQNDLRSRSPPSHVSSIWISLYCPPMSPGRQR